MKEKINEICTFMGILSGIAIFFLAMYSYIEKTSLEIEKLKYELSIYKENEEKLK